MKKVEQKFVTYPIAVLLKELGFDEECFGCFGVKHGTLTITKMLGQDKENKLGLILAPLWQDAIEWLKDKRILVTELWDGWEVAKDGDDFVYYKTKEEAVTKGLEILKEEQNENRTN